MKYLFPLLIVVGAASQAARAEVDYTDLSLEQLLSLKVVSASLQEQSPLNAPSSVYVVSGEEIRTRGYRTIKQIMVDVPGFEDVSDANEEIVAVRGLFASTSNKILTLIDGHRMNDLMLGRYNMDQFLGMDAVERVEFIRGAGSALYGTGALAGVVNIILKKGEKLKGSEARVKVGNLVRELSLTGGAKASDWDVMYNFTFLDAPGERKSQPAEVDKPAPNNPTQSPGNVYLGNYPDNWSGVVTLAKDRSSVVARASHFRRTTPRGSSGSLYDYDAEPFKAAYTENDFFVDYRYTFDFATTQKLTFNPSFHYFGYYEQSFFDYTSLKSAQDANRSGTQAEMQHIQAKITYENQLTSTLNLLTQLDWLYAKFYRMDVVAENGSLPYSTVYKPEGYTELGNWYLGGLLAQAVWHPFEFLDFTAGARYDTFQGAAPSMVTPRVGIVYRPFQTFSTKLLYGRSYMSPNWAQKRSADPNFKGNPDLKPEVFDGLDLVFQFQNGQTFFAEADFFVNYFQQSINATGTAPNKYYNNTQESSYHGAEFSAKYQPVRLVRVDGSLSLIAPNVAGTSDTLLQDGTIKYIPEVVLRYGFRIQATERLNFGLTGRTYGRVKTTDTVLTERTSIDPATIFDMSANYGLKDFDFQLIGHNILNTQYEVGGTVGRPLPQLDASLEGAVSYRL